MTLAARIESAFGHRLQPESVLESHRSDDCDHQDAIWFLGRDWRSLSEDDWYPRHAEVSFFSPPAFQYFLPSIIGLSASGSGACFEVAASVLRSLDRSPVPEYWDDWILPRFGDLHSDEYAVIKDWLIRLSDFPTWYDSASLGRAFDTIALFEARATSR